MPKNKVNSPVFVYNDSHLSLNISTALLNNCKQNITHCLSWLARQYMYDIDACWLSRRQHLTLYSLTVFANLLNTFQIFSA